MTRYFLIFLTFFALPAAAQPAKWTEVEMERPVPQEASALGHHGVVTLEGDITAEGRTSNMVLVGSSRSPLLDAEALRLFTTPRAIAADLRANGETRIRIKLDFNSYDLSNMGLGYLCSQAVRDADWFASHSPGVPVEPSKFSLYLQGTGLIVERMAFALDDKRFAAAWTEALAWCRSHPQAPFMGVVALAGGNKLPKR